MGNTHKYTQVSSDAERGTLGLIELVDDEGNIQQYEHLMTLTHNDISYLALTTIQEDEDESSDEEVAVGFLRMETQSDGSDIYKDDVPERIVSELFVKLEELMNEEDEGDEDE